MPGILPNPIVNPDGFGAAYNKLRDHARAQQPVPSAGGRTAHTVHGVGYEPDPAPPPYGLEPSAAALSTWFTGLYDAGVTYSAQQVCVYTPDGGQAGAYVCLVSGTVGITPDTGAPNWFAWPAPAPGVWSA